ncbi:MAG: hypothetical protein D6741_03970 [Planctomycetota bacterium]|nr:MAG: hypothetical protein D6741_03970 [Planctomycetota bacterium]
MKAARDRLKLLTQDAYTIDAAHVRQVEEFLTTELEALEEAAQKEKEKHSNNDAESDSESA